MPEAHPNGTVRSFEGRVHESPFSQASEAHQQLRIFAGERERNPASLPPLTFHLPSRWSTPLPTLPPNNLCIWPPHLFSVVLLGVHLGFHWPIIVNRF